jgi:sterol desaturase/sphingolipid hydroxylase (fatty acid hydroxylase superfamily)
MTRAAGSRKLAVAIAIYLPLAALFIAWNAAAGGFSDPAWPLLVAAGLLLWTLIEYLLHRFAFHYPFRSRRVQAVQAELHLAHHARPDELELIVAGPSFSLPIALVIWVLLRLALGTWAQASLVMAAAMVGYLCYEVVHFSIHTRLKGGPLLQFWRRHHFFHHFSDASRCFGVTSPLWDLVFGTGRRRTH